MKLFESESFTSCAANANPRVISTKTSIYEYWMYAVVYLFSLFHCAMIAAGWAISKCLTRRCQTQSARTHSHMHGESDGIVEKADNALLSRRLRSGSVCELRSAFSATSNAVRRCRAWNSYLMGDWGDYFFFHLQWKRTVHLNKSNTFVSIQACVCVCVCVRRAVERWRKSVCIWNKLQKEVKLLWNLYSLRFYFIHCSIVCRPLHCVFFYFFFHKILWR